MNANVTKKSDTEVVVEVELPSEELEKHRSDALKHLGKDVELKGFRKGKVPEDVLKKHVSEDQILQEMANRAISGAISKVIEEHVPRIIGRPHVSVTKLAAGNPLEFTVIAATLPEVTLADYKKIAGEQNNKKSDPQAGGEVTDKEMEEAIQDILKRVGEAEKQAKEQKTEDGVPIIGEGAPAEPAELTDEFVKKLGPYENVADFKAKLRRQMQTRKEHMAAEKHRLSIIEKVVKETDPKVPELLVDAEIDKMLGQMRADIERAGLKLEDYMKQIGKSEEDFRKEWRGDAEKRAKIQLVLNEIAQAENIRADQQEVENQTKAILAQHPPQGGDMKQAEIATKIYVDTMLTNEKVFEFLENQKT